MMLAHEPIDLPDLLHLARTAHSPAEALRALAELREELAQLEHEQVQRALDAGASFSDLARMLGISRQAAHRRYRRATRAAPEVSLEPAATITREARAAIEFALEEAGRRGSDPR